MIPYKHINVLIMPTDYCNMNCMYCFNSRKNDKQKSIIRSDILHKIFSTTIPYYKEVRYIWHGGEPTSVGLEFYRNAIKLQNDINRFGTTVENSIQTNLTLLDNQFADFLVKNNFHIGSSFDGTQNELTRHNSEKILRGREIVIDAGGKVGFIYVVQSKNIDHLIEDYEWFKVHKMNYTLNMYLSQPPYDNDQLYVSPWLCAEKICELFDHWVYDEECHIHISFFDDFIDYILFGEKYLCCYNSCLGKNIGIREDGSIYNCNRDSAVKYCYGSIMDYTDIHECFESSGFLRSVDAAYRRREYCKENCTIFGFCSGGCNNCAEIGGDYAMPNEHICIITRSVYNHISQKIKDMTKGSDQTFVKKLRLNGLLKEKLIRYSEARNNNSINVGGEKNE